MHHFCTSFTSAIPGTFRGALMQSLLHNRRCALAKQDFTLQFRRYSENVPLHLSEPVRLSSPPSPRFRSNPRRTIRRSGSPGSNCSLRDESTLIWKQPWSITDVYAWVKWTVFKNIDNSVLQKKETGLLVKTVNRFIPWIGHSPTSWFLGPIRFR